MSTRCVLDFHQMIDAPPLARLYCRYNGQPKYQLPRLRKALDLSEDQADAAIMGGIELNMADFAGLYLLVSKTGVGDVFIDWAVPWNIEYLFQVFPEDNTVKIRVLTPTKSFVWAKSPRPSMMRLLVEGLLDDLMLSFEALRVS